MGEELVRRQGVALALALLSVAACAEKTAENRLPAGRRVAADVIEIHESLSAEARAFRWLVVHHEGKVRLGNETDRWRLIDLQESTVTFVDDITRTYRRSSIAELRALRLRELQRPLPSPFQPIAIQQTTQTESIAGVPTRKIEMERGGYRREVWMSVAPVIHPDLHKAILVTDPISEPYAGLLRRVVPGLLSQSGFPLRDVSVLEYGEKRMEIERIVRSIGKRQVPESWFEVPRDYADVTPREPDADRPNASSPRSGRDAREAGPRSSATTRTSP
jgi:hypothetical protein